jgi:hypothetical protein
MEAGTLSRKELEKRAGKLLGSERRARRTEGYRGQVGKKLLIGADLYPIDGKSSLHSFGVKVDRFGKLGAFCLIRRDNCDS